MYRLLHFQRFFVSNHNNVRPTSLSLLNILQSLPSYKLKIISVAARNISFTRLSFEDKNIRENHQVFNDDLDKINISGEELGKVEADSIKPHPIKKQKHKPVAHKIEFSEKDLKEKFIKGSGNGGQAINKTNSCVEISHIPTGIVIQKTRSQAQNRKIARKILLEKLDDHINGKFSKSGLKAAKVLKQRKKQRKRALTKIHGPKPSETLIEHQEDSEDKPTEPQDKANIFIVKPY